MRVVLPVLLLVAGGTLGLVLGAEMPGPAALARALADAGDPFGQLVLHWRLPRVLAAGLVGAGLGLAGAIFQGVFRNPLAEPYLLGSAPGAAVGAAVALLVPLPVPQMLSLPVLAFAGAWGASWAVIGLSRLAGIVDAAGLLLVGIAISALLGALRSLLLLALSDETVNLQSVLSWTLGGIQTPGWADLGLLAALTGGSVILALGLARGLDLLGLGDEVAANMGVPVGRFLARAVLIAAAITAVAVAWGGLVGFVGLIVPHVARWIGGPDHRGLLWRSAIGGAAMLMAMDGLARAVLPPAEIPLGLLTAVIGAPFFLLILWRRGRA